MTDKLEQIKAEMVDAAESLGISQEEYEKIVDECIFGEEPVSKELEKAAVEAFKKIVDSDKNNFLEIFNAGAEWKKEQFEKNRLKHCDSITNEQAELEQGFIDQHLDKYQRMPTFLDAIEYGMQLHKQEMMKDAISCKLCWYDGFYLDYTEEELCNVVGKRPLEVGDVLKVIIIKED